MLSDLMSGPSETAIAWMHDWMSYDPRMSRRGNAKPCIEIVMGITSKGNLSVEWRPKYHFDVPPEFKSLWDDMNQPPRRTLRELIFIRGVCWAQYMLTDVHTGVSRPIGGVIAKILLIATAALIKDLRNRLECSFEVQLITGIFMTWSSCEDNATGTVKADLLDWRIANVAEQELDELQKSSGCPIGAFAAAVDRSIRKKRTGPALTSSNMSVLRELRSAGFKGLKLKGVEKYRTLLRKCHPELLPVWDRPLPQGPSKRGIPWHG